MKSISEFSVRLVTSLRDTFPPGMDTATTNRARALRKKGVESLLTEIFTYGQQRRPGLIKRFWFARTFQKQLAIAGYSADFVRQITTAALMELTKPKN